MQMTIVGAVCCANVYYGWTDNGYAAGLLGVFLAYMATILIFKIQDLSAARKSRKLSLPIGLRRN